MRWLATTIVSARWAVKNVPESVLPGHRGPARRVAATSTVHRVTAIDRSGQGWHNSGNRKEHRSMIQ